MPALRHHYAHLNVFFRAVLLNVDDKLAARTIAARLLKIIHLVVAKDQTCGVPGRYIGEHVAFLCDVVSYSTLRRMGFGTSFLNWVNLFYTGVQSSVNVNGYLSHFLPLSWRPSGLPSVSSFVCACG